MSALEMVKGSLLTLERHGPGLADLDAVQETVIALGKEQARGSSTDCEDVLENITTMLKEVFEPSLNRTRDTLQANLDAQMKAHDDCHAIDPSNASQYDSTQLTTTFASVNDCHADLKEWVSRYSKAECTDVDHEQNDDAARKHEACSKYTGLKRLVQEYTNSETGSCHRKEGSSASLGQFMLNNYNRFKQDRINAEEYKRTCADFSDAELGKKAVCFWYNDTVEKRRQSCHANQTTFEHEACKRVQFFTKLCKESSLCRKALTDNYCKTRNATRSQEKDLMEEWRKVQELFCEIDAVLKHGGEEKVTQCGMTGFDASSMTLTYFKVKPFKPCLAYPIPGTGNFSSSYNTSGGDDAFLADSPSCAVDNLLG
jgi:hypothetical protein